VSVNVQTVHRLPAAVLWDMDGTLVDTEPYWFEVERELVESYGGEWPDHHAKAVVGFDLLDSAEYIRQHGGVPLDPHEIVDIMLDGVIARLRERIPWRPGARRLLRDLNEAGVPCALVTMSWRRFVDPVVAALPPGTFDAVITGDEVPAGQGKPNPTPYLMAAGFCSADPRDCVAIEDSPTGVQAARDAGCRVLGVPNVRSLSGLRGLTIVGSLRDITIDDLAELPEPSSPDAVDPERRRRLAMLGGLAVVAALLLAFAFLRGGGDEQPVELPPGAIPVDVWAPYWTLTDSQSTLESRLRDVREASPFWFGARGVTEIVVDENASQDAIDEFVDVARDSVARFVPSIRDEMPAGGMAAVLADPTTRQQHIDTIVEFADEQGADGIDLDYEKFAFSDGDSTWAATSPNWVAFIEDLAAALHDDGRTLTVSIPPVYDPAVSGGSGYWVYDHGAIAEHADAIRIMAYDYSVDEPGPIAPLSWVAQAVDGVSKAVPEEYHHKLVLGVPAYGSNWVTSTTGNCPSTAEGKTTVTSQNVLELAALRGGTPSYDPALGEWSFTYDLPVTDAATSCVQTRMVRWVDSEGAAARAEIARRAGWGGAALWALGYDDDEVWTALLDATRSPLEASAPTT
jgi:HAD superfamily hydrolase (TIGR01509 family)